MTAAKVTTDNPAPVTAIPNPPVWASLTAQQQRQIALVLAAILCRHLAAANMIQPEAPDARES
jgi:hypothetical protein